MSAVIFEDAEHAMRHWTAAEPGAVSPGSEAHKRLFCRMLIETHHPYKPSVLRWPRLDARTLDRVTELPIWNLAVQTEDRASVRVASFAATVRDPLLREALEINAGEEARHRQVLGRLIETYGIELAPEPVCAPPKRPQWAWLVTGYGECVDSFFAFGLFALAKRSGFFPAELVETFEPVMQEKGRHILFFTNWSAWHRRRLRWWRRPLFALQVWAVWTFLVLERIGIARGIDAEGAVQDASFTFHGSGQIGVELKPRELLELCLVENERRMAGYDPRLLRPIAVPRLARWARRFL